jgi:predicted ferric reductase
MNRAFLGPATMVILYVVPLLLWADSAPLETRFVDTSTTLTSVGVLFGLAGVSGFAMNLILGGRLRFVERLLGGLERMYKAHRVNGRIAFLLILTHGILIFSSRASVSLDAAVDLLTPGSGWTVFIGPVALLLMTISIVLTLYVRMGHEVFVYVQRSFGFIFLIASFHVFTTQGAKASSRALTVYMAVLALAGIAAWTYRSLFGNLLVRRHPYRVVLAIRRDESVTDIVMTPEEKPLRYTPGQFVFVNFRSLALSRQFQPLEVTTEAQSAVFSIRAGEVSNQFHPFSITSSPNDDELRITVKGVGDYTRALRQLEAGALAIVEGPYGEFSHRNLPDRNQIWIAGGIGVTPFLSMARSLEEDEELSADIYYAVETDDEALFLDELETIAARREGLRVIPVIREKVGFLTADKISELSGGLQGRDIMICGPPAMLETLRAQLISKGVSDERIHSEEFGFARRPATKARPAKAPR